MLLRAIEEKVFYPLGSDREVSSDFQIICRTNRGLRALIARGDFREDLFARINLSERVVADELERLQGASVVVVAGSRRGGEVAPALDFGSDDFPSSFCHQPMERA
jgi:hypothetical protein